MSKMSIYTAYLRNMFTREEYMTLSREHRNKIRYFLRIRYSEKEFRDLFSTFQSYDIVLDTLSKLESVTNVEINAVKNAKQRMQSLIDRDKRRSEFRRRNEFKHS